MQVKDIMTENPVCCTRASRLSEVARMMVEHDCGSIPVVEDKQTMKLIGMITDRDITCRVVAMNKNPLEMTVGQIMSTPVVTATAEMSLDECCQLMEEKQIRRIPVVDQSGRCCGVVAQADIARQAPEHETAEVLREVSQPTESSSRIR